MKMDIKQIGFTIKRVTTEQFAIIEENFKETSNARLSVNFRFGMDHPGKLVSVFSQFTFGTNKMIFMRIEAGCHFQIIPEAWSDMINSESKTILLPRGFVQHLAMLTIGTTRGILHAKTEGTCYNKFIIPAINVTELIPEDITFNF